MFPITELGFDTGAETERIERLISSVLSARRASGLVLGLSGGLDSAVAAGLAVRACGAQRVKAWIMPERDSAAESTEDARLLADDLGIECQIEDLGDALRNLGCYEGAASGIVRMGKGVRLAVNLLPGAARKGFIANLEGAGGRQFRQFISFYRIKHRLRMVVLHREAERRNMLVMSCANRTEFDIGLFVRYGDDSGDIAPIKHLYKTQVFSLGRHLGIPERILAKKPSPDLFAGMMDEEILGIGYPELDSLLWCLSAGMSASEAISKTGSSAETVEYVEKIMSRSAHLRQPPESLPPVGG